MSESPVLRVHAVIDSLAWGGAEGLLSDFAVASRSANIELTVSYLQDRHGSAAADRLRAHGIEPVLLAITGLLKPGDIRRVRRHLATVAPDIVHTHLGYSDVMAGLAAWSLRVPTVSTIHVMEWEGDRRERVKLQIAAAVRRRSAARVITVSDAARAAFLATGWDRPDRVVTVPNGIVGSARTGAGAALRAAHGVDRSTPVVGMLSVLRDGKGHDVAIAAFQRVTAEIPNVRLMIAGDGPARAQVERLASPFGDRVILVGHQSDPLAFLDAVDLLLHPSRMDAFPTSLLEAMAARVPIVATAVGGIAEIIEHERTGILVPPPPQAEPFAAAVLALLRDDGRRRRLTEIAREEFTARYGMDAWAWRTRAVYEEALDRAPKSALIPEGG